MKLNNILYSVEDDIATITIDRPKALNSLNSETIAELGVAVDQAVSSEEALGVIITGAGGRAFVAGADISELATKDPVSGREFALAGQNALNKIEQCPKPVIAAVGGFALGGGCELAMACHLRVVSSTARFGQPEVGLGLIPGFGGTQRLPRLVGKGRALELLLGGGMINAAEAFRIGLANCVVEAWKVDDEGKEILSEKGKKVFDNDIFLSEVHRMMKGFITKGPVALAYVIEAVNRGLDTSLEEGLRTEADLFGVIYATEDTSEGLNAYLEKREAKFKGK